MTAIRVAGVVLWLGGAWLLVFGSLGMAIESQPARPPVASTPAQLTADRTAWLAGGALGLGVVLVLVGGRR